MSKDRGNIASGEVEDGSYASFKYRNINKLILISNKSPGNG